MCGEMEDKFPRLIVAAFQQFFSDVGGEEDDLSQAREEFSTRSRWNDSVVLVRRGSGGDGEGERGGMREARREERGEWRGREELRHFSRLVDFGINLGGLLRVPLLDCLGLGLVQLWGGKVKMGEQAVRLMRRSLPGDHRSARPWTRPSRCGSPAGSAWSPRNS